MLVLNLCLILKINIINSSQPTCPFCGSISNASKLKVLSALTADRSMTSIVREHNVSVNTVQRILAPCSHRFLDFT